MAVATSKYFLTSWRFCEDYFFFISYIIFILPYKYTYICMAIAERAVRSHAIDICFTWYRYKTACIDVYVYYLLCLRALSSPDEQCIWNVVRTCVCVCVCLCPEELQGERTGTASMPPVQLSMYTYFSELVHLYTHTQVYSYVNILLLFYYLWCTIYIVGLGVAALCLQGLPFTSLLLV